MPEHLQGMTIVGLVWLSFWVWFVVFTILVLVKLEKIARLLKK